MADATSLAEAHISNEWIATASINSTSAITDALLSELENEFTTAIEVHRTSFNGWPSDELERATKGVRLNPFGIPSDDSILSLGFGQNELFKGPVDLNTGTLFIVPLLPFQGRCVEHASRIIEEEFHSCGFIPYMTLNLIEGSCFEAVVNLTFPRDDSQKRGSARKVIRRTFVRLERAGYPSQRMSIFQMRFPQKISAAHRKALQELKALVEHVQSFNRPRSLSDR